MNTQVLTELTESCAAVIRTAASEKQNAVRWPNILLNIWDSKKERKKEGRIKPGRKHTHLCLPQFATDLLSVLGSNILVERKCFISYVVNVGVLNSIGPGLDPKPKSGWPTSFNDLQMGDWPSLTFTPSKVCLERSQSPEHLAAQNPLTPANQLKTQTKSPTSYLANPQLRTRPFSSMCNTSHAL